MKQKQLKYIINCLTDKGIRFDKGLTDDEVLQIEDKFNFIFPPDLRMFLQTLLPNEKGFVNWRLGLNNRKEAKNINLRINAPLEGILFDIKYNNLWIEDWGISPKNDEYKAQIVTKLFDNYPKLIPIYSHRYMPCEPYEKDNPVFSVYQSDIIYYGFNLANYFANEFGFKLIDDFEQLSEPKKIIKFWSSWTQ
jgi:hypothetical protein